MKPCTCYKPGFWKRLLAFIFLQRKPLCICENVRLPSKEEKRTSDLIKKPVRSTLTNTTLKPVRYQATPARPAARTQGGSMDTNTNDTINQMNLVAATIITTAPPEPAASSSSSSSSNEVRSSSHSSSLSNSYSSSDSYSDSSYDSSSSSF